MTRVLPTPATKPTNAISTAGKNHFLGSETRRRKKIQKKLIGKRSKVKLMKIKERNGRKKMEETGK